MTSLRLASHDDVATLAHTYTTTYNSLNIGERWTNESALQLITYLYLDQPDLFFLAENDDIVVGGIVATVRPWWDGNHLIDGELFIHPDHQKKKIGVMLVKKLFETAKEKYNAVSWDTFTHKVYEHPLSWYKSLGFEEIQHWTMIAGKIDNVLKTIRE